MDQSLDDLIAESKKSGGPQRTSKAKSRPGPYSENMFNGRGGGRGRGRGGGRFGGGGGRGGFAGRGRGGGGAPGCSLYVGNLDWGVAWQDLKDHFKQCGHVISADVMQEGPGRSKGCGIVVFADERDAQRAIAELNETELKGRNIFVREDREVGGGADRGPLHSVYVGNLAYPVEWWALKDHFKQAGDVVHAEVMQESDGRSKGCGIVSFGSAEEAQARCGAARHAPAPHHLLRAIPSPSSPSALTPP